MKNIVIIAGPSGSGKNSVMNEVFKKVKNSVDFITATTRKPREGENDGVDYFFFSKERFENELKKGNILEHYYRSDTDTYYGSYKPYIEESIRNNKILLGDLQIVGAKFYKEHYNATTIFILPPDLDILEKRVRSRADMSDAEWAERLKHLEREMTEDIGFYDYKIKNEDGRLKETVKNVFQILEKEGFELQLQGQ